MIMMIQVQTFNVHPILNCFHSTHRHEPSNSNFSYLPPPPSTTTSTPPPPMMYLSAPDFDGPCHHQNCGLFFPFSTQMTTLPSSSSSPFLISHHHLHHFFDHHDHPDLPNSNDPNGRPPCPLDWLYAAAHSGQSAY